MPEPRKAELAEIYQMLAFMEIDKENTPGAIEMLKKATGARPDNALLWSNLGANTWCQELSGSRSSVGKGTQLQPSFAKAHLNLGSAYRGVKEYEKAMAEYQQALQLFPATRTPSSTWASFISTPTRCPIRTSSPSSNAAIAYLQQYKQMVASVGQAVAPEADSTSRGRRTGSRGTETHRAAEKQEERDRQRAAKKAADDANKAAGPAPGAAVPASAAFPAASPKPAVPASPVAPTPRYAPVAPAAVPPAAPASPAPRKWP